LTLKEFEVNVIWKSSGTFRIIAENEDKAKSIAKQRYLDGEDFDYDTQYIHEICVDDLEFKAELSE